MKLKFNSNLDYQRDAVKSVTDLFDGQQVMDSFSSFSVSGQRGLLDEGLGVGNKLHLSDEDILKNLNRVQNYNKLAPSSSLDGLDFNIEMETGTGKTYVYLKTIFELNKLYGFTKFIIVVPNVAIREGVYKTIQITRDHFKGLYDNVVYDYFLYDSSKLEQVRNFAISSSIEIMIINIDAFNKSFKNPSKETKANIIHRELDKFNGYKPIDLISETNPVVIIDEPQSVVGTSKSKEAIASLNPLCTLRYSATHKEIQNLVYKLDPVDAYELGLVKQIEVASLESDNYHNDAYMKLISTDNLNSPITAKIEIDAVRRGKVKREVVQVRKGDDLSESKLGNRDIYEGYIVDEIYCEEGNEFVSFSPKDLKLRKNITSGDVNDLTIKRAQISKTIEEHLDKELDLHDKGIKVLSLFFIDKVANYRQYDSDGNNVKGPYARIFEEEYNRIIKRPKYSELDIVPVDDVHNGYFSIDKKTGNFKDSKETKKGKLRSNKDDESTFNLIMKNKEKLLSFDSPLKFIFSHSALREGWDNPNVFQICTLNETTSTMKKRQEIGRGLRLCVNQDGERVTDRNTNRLTIMANESYKDFADSLQKEMEQDVGLKFGIIEKTSFARIVFTNRKGEEEKLGNSRSQQIYNHFKKNKYIDKKGKVQNALKEAIKTDTVSVPDQFKDIREEITDVARNHTKKIEIKNANVRRKIKVNKHVYLDNDFKEFWNKIKHKTTYSVNFDSDKLIEECQKALNNEIQVKPPKLLYTKSGLVINASGVNTDEELIETVDALDDEIMLPDILSYLQNETSLTRKTIIDILVNSNTLDQFKVNPQDYMEQALKIINREMSQFIIDGIKYTKLDDYYEQSLFKNEELYGYLERNMIEVEHSVYDHILYDSEVEKRFVERLEKDSEVKLYTKLPYWFKINTPLGGYNPDWAILLKNNGEHNLYFVVETKGTRNKESLRPTEKDKIICGKKHFQALQTNVTFDYTDSYEDFKKRVVD